MKKLVIGAALLSLAALSAPSYAAEPTIPIIVKDTTSFYWQIVLAGARKAGQDLGVKVPELGAQSEFGHHRPDFDPRERRRREARGGRHRAHRVQGAR